MCRLIHQLTMTLLLLTTPALHAVAADWAVEATTELYSMTPGARRIADLHYGPSAAETYDVYLPQTPQQAPLLVMVHGGAWRHGDKAMRPVVQHKVARWVPRGAVVVSINYPMLPQAMAFEQAQAVARAIAAIQRRAGEWGADSEQVILMGHSAGAHLVALLSANPALVTAAGG